MIRHDGSEHRVMVRQMPVEQCRRCSEFTIGNDGDEAIDAALRETLGLMSPTQIRDERIRLGLTQEALASAIGCASESISRWENGKFVQSAAYDRWLRAYFALPELRSFFAGENYETVLLTSWRTTVVLSHDDLVRTSDRSDDVAHGLASKWQAPATPDITGARAA